jgi:hypothetical protein
MPAGRDDDRLLVVTEGEVTAEIAGRPGAVPAEAVMVLGFLGSGCPRPLSAADEAARKRSLCARCSRLELTGLGDAQMTSTAGPGSPYFMNCALPRA